MPDCPVTMPESPVTIDRNTQRRRIARHLHKNPSLKNVLPETYQDTYGYAVLAAAKETCIDAATFPAQCPWSFEQTMNNDFWPEAPVMMASDKG